MAVESTEVPKGAVVCHCPSCGKVLKAPVRLIGTQVACPGCGSRFAVSDGSGGDEPPARGRGKAAASDSVFLHFGDAFAYPLRGSATLFGSSVVVQVVVALVSWIPIIGLVAGVFGFAWLALVLCTVIRASASGETAPPVWIDLEEDGLVEPTLGVVGLGVITLLPGGLLLAFHSWQAGLAVLLIGIVCLPMMLLVFTFYGIGSALRLHWIWLAISRVAGEYLLLVFMLGIVAVVRTASLYVADYVPVLGPVLMLVLSVYFWMVFARLVGVLYDVNKGKLSWFGEGS